MLHDQQTYAVSLAAGVAVADEVDVLVAAGVVAVFACLDEADYFAGPVRYDIQPVAEPEKLRY